MSDPAFMARLARHRAYLERRQRLGFPDACRKLKLLDVLEQRARLGLVVAKPPPLVQAPEISEAQVREACRDLVKNLPDPRLSVTGRTERRGPMRRATRGFDLI